MGDLVLYLGIILVGYFIGSRLRHVRDKLAWTGRVQTVAIVILVFTMGLRIGANKEVVTNLDTIGLYAFIMTVAVIAMTVVCIYIARKLLGINRYGLMTGASASDEDDKDENKATGGGILDKTMVLIIAAVAVGIICGYMLIDVVSGDFERFNSGAGLVIKLGLCTLLIFVGMDLGLDGKVVDNFKAVGIRVMAIPAATAVGTLLGAWLCSLFLPLTGRECLAVGAGFGWYSLAPGIIMDKGYVVTGAISFMHNVMREIVSIITIPFVAKFIGYVECCGVPGSSAMDICLPIVERTTSSNTAVYSFISGVSVTILVPILVPLFL